MKYPEESSLVFDVEVLVKLGKFPTLAVAASDKAWYCWISPIVFNHEASDKYLIPLKDAD